MFAAWKSDILPIGIDVGNDAVKMVQLRRLPAGEGAGAAAPRYAVIAAARRRFSDAARAQPESRLAELPQLIRQLRQSEPFIGRRAVPAMPSPWLVFRTLRLADGHPMNRAAIFDRLHPQLPAPPGECRLGIIPCGSVRQGSESAEEVLAFAAPIEAIDRFLEALHRGGLTPEALDVEQCAAWRAFARAADSESADDRALLEMGECRSVLMIGRGGTLRFAKPMEVGSRQLDDAICRRLGLSADDARELRVRGHVGAEIGGGGETVQTALADATRGLLEKLSAGIVQCLRYYAVAFRGSPVRGMYFSGADSIDPHLLAAMQSVPLPMGTWDSFQNIDITPLRRADRRGTMGQWTVALGLALRGESPAAAIPEPEAAHA
ncbi:MAG TPA: pilus assembly protein PilM [Tepidisphaeraceae bacterium]|jgi:type IV pilus assembly protein PilM|nr:pilus assembly protein PilM [Tepidisphaeraceae bacterium]